MCCATAKFAARVLHLHRISCSTGALGGVERYARRFAAARIVHPHGLQKASMRVVLFLSTLVVLLLILPRPTL
jgi:hypothetical protein